MVFDNPVGTAPGCAFESDGVHVLMLPGPPHEMETMLRRHVEPYLRKLSHEVIVSQDIMTFGMGESSIDQLLHEKMAHMTNPTLATYAKPCEVRLRATAKAATEDEAYSMLAPVGQMVLETLGDIVYGVDGGDLADCCHGHLIRRGLTLATAESCTGGLVAQRLTAIPGISAVYRGGVVSYWTSVKAEVLHVPQDVLDTYGPVSEECARAMAEGVRRITGADLGVSVTGAAGPDPDERGVPVGIVYIGLATPEGTFCRRLDLGRRRRDRIQGLAANPGRSSVRWSGSSATPWTCPRPRSSAIGSRRRELSSPARRFQWRSAWRCSRVSLQHTESQEGGPIMSGKKLKGIALLLFGILLSASSAELNSTIFAGTSDLPFSLLGLVIGAFGLVMVFVKDQEGK